MEFLGEPASAAPLKVDIPAPANARKTPKGIVVFFR
jgi:hypothetical protein